MKINDLWAIFGLSSGREVQFDSLDGLRGLAVSFVVITHYTGEGMLFPRGLGLHQTGKNGVLLFFVLSSFLLTVLLLQKSNDDLKRPGIWMDYACRRFLRIYPLFLTILGLSLLFNVTRVFRWAYPLSWGEVVRHIFLFQGKYLFWTIPVEFKHYLLLPLIVILLVFLLRRSTWFGCLSLAVLVAAAQWAWPAGDPARNDINYGMYAPTFLTGSLAAVVHCALRKQGPLPQWFRGFLEIVAWVALVTAYVSFCRYWRVFPLLRVPPRTWEYRSLFFGILWSLVVLAHLHGTGVMRSVFSARPLRFIGVISFSMYLWHMPVGILSRELHLSPLGRTVTTYSIMILLSALSFLVIERPFLRRARTMRF